MNLILWILRRWGIAVGTLLLLGFPGVAARSAIQLSQGVSQQREGNPATAAERAFTEGDQLYQQGTAESLRQAIAKFEEALKLYREVGNNGGQAISLLALGRIYSELGEKQKALEYYNQSLSLSRAVADRGGEARTLNNIGLVYSELGEKQKALEYYSQSLPLSRAVGDRIGEARTLNNIGLVYSELGEKQKALEYYSQSLPLS
ncbi:tetratricopeptide repeat protein, partial [Kamptonema animale CS-326]|uniref:tetratricopeptide repeat protein n=1 Tax=Kamptonema animale TaxID=92934 RepID=UPI00232D864A